jgi:hypothetical protein
MERNVGGIDRVLRIVAGAGLVAWALLGDGPYHLWGWIGVLPLATGLLGWCPAYMPFGWKTCRAP